ncbi:uncharacterized protein CLUP02_14953 [Colletotrichum lupini]|uniref:Uncharacterized protein n=1 Tax=Colletotrichum lupini TaxID=145971 RepID=A0A9Q8WMT8_9PEZI|nr:uncharacterized protein CLUP02_14953 [Colletotrichum lupini]UQC89423.1 hypothetical protein CLUP02_14953 [Colletotrichum lupini]
MVFYSLPSPRVLGEDRGGLQTNNSLTTPPELGTSNPCNRNPLSSEDEIICWRHATFAASAPHKFRASIHARIQAKFHADSRWGKLQSSDTDTDTAPGIMQRSKFLCKSIRWTHNPLQLGWQIVYRGQIDIGGSCWSFEPGTPGGCDIGNLSRMPRPLFPAAPLIFGTSELQLIRELSPTRPSTERVVRLIVSSEPSGLHVPVNLASAIFNQDGTLKGHWCHFAPPVEERIRGYSCCRGPGQNNQPLLANEKLSRTFMHFESSQHLSIALYHYPITVRTIQRPIN